LRSWSGRRLRRWWRGGEVGWRRRMQARLPGLQCIRIVCETTLVRVQHNFVSGNNRQYREVFEKFREINRHPQSRPLVRSSPTPALVRRFPQKQDQANPPTFIVAPMATRLSPPTLTDGNGHGGQAAVTNHAVLMIITAPNHHEQYGRFRINPRPCGSDDPGQTGRQHAENQC
jgi:hypothetical protein